MDCFHQVIPFIYESSDSKLFLYDPVFMECIGLCMDTLENRAIRKKFVYRAAVSVPHINSACQYCLLHAYIARRRSLLIAGTEP